MAWSRNDMAQRAAKELQDGFYVNLGIGIPTLVANFIPSSLEVTLQSENGMLGMGPFPFDDEVDADLINAGKQTITELDRTSYFSSAEGGAMDLVAGVKRVVVVMDHNSKSGAPKLLKQCSLPLTGQSVVDMVISNVGVFEIERGRRMLLTELAPDMSIDEARDLTQAHFEIAL